MNEMALIETRGYSDPSFTNGCLESHRGNNASVGEFDVRLTANRLSAPECGGENGVSLHKSLTSSSLVDVSEGAYKFTEKKQTIASSSVRLTDFVMISYKLVKKQSVEHFTWYARQRSAVELKLSTGALDVKFVLRFLSLIL
jgi:hypothetical protein